MHPSLRLRWWSRRLVWSALSGVVAVTLYNHPRLQSSFQLRVNAMTRSLHSRVFNALYRPHLSSLFASLRGTVLDLRPGAAHHVSSMPRNVVYEAVEPNLLTWAALSDSLEEFGAPVGTFALTGIEPLQKLRQTPTASQDQVLMMFCLSSVSELANDTVLSRSLLSPLALSPHSANATSTERQAQAQGSIDEPLSLTPSSTAHMQRDLAVSGSTHELWKEILSESYRVLKPGGRLYAIEHSSHDEQSSLNSWSIYSGLQQACSSFTRAFLGGLRVDRPIAATVLHQQQQQQRVFPAADSNASRTSDIHWQQVYMECWNHATDRFSRQGISQVQLHHDFDCEPLEATSTAAHNVAVASAGKVTGLQGLFPLIAFIAVKKQHQDVSSYVRDNGVTVDELFKYGEKKYR